MITLWHPSGVMPLACVQAQYIFYYSQHFGAKRCCILCPAMLHRCVYVVCLCCHVLLYCFCIWPLKATPSNRVWPCFDRCLFCFVFILLSHRTMPRPLCPKMTARRLGPSGFPRQACVHRTLYLQHLHPASHQCNCHDIIPTHLEITIHSQPQFNYGPGYS